MARTALTAVEPSSGGTTYTLAAANADGHSFANSGQTMLFVANGSGGSINVTLQTPGTADGLAIADKVVAVGAGATKFIGNLPKNVYNRTDGTVYVDFSAVTDVTVLAIEP